MLPFQLDGRQNPVACVFAGQIVEYFDVVEYVGPRLIPRAVDLAADLLALEQDEKALGHGIVVAVAATVLSRQR